MKELRYYLVGYANKLKENEVNNDALIIIENLIDYLDAYNENTYVDTEHYKLLLDATSGMEVTKGVIDFFLDIASQNARLSNQNDIQVLGNNTFSEDLFRVLDEEELPADIYGIDLDTANRAR